ncbi:MAG: hypothetical protein WBC51_27850 [Vicinamibacterales bacterium]
MIEAVIQAVRGQGQPSSGDNLAGFAIDADHYVAEGGALVDVDVRTTDRPECLVEVRATVADHVQSLQDVASALREAWTSLAYSDLQATSCGWYREATVLRFVTAMQRPALFVTGRIVARGGPQERLVERFIRDFSALHGQLPHLPEGWR